MSDYASPAAAAARDAIEPPVIYRWRCPVCQGTGRWADGEGCHHCYGRGLLEEEPDPAVWNGPGEHERAPLPPALMAAPCGDCAFRPGSPEEEGGDHDAPAHRRPAIGPHAPFWCHHQLHETGGAYTPTAWWNGAPLGALLCRGWWNVHVEGLPAPERAFREPKGTP